eukprot:2812607-Prymnesium_polylepis.1
MPANATQRPKSEAASTSWAASEARARRVRVCTSGMGRGMRVGAAMGCGRRVWARMWAQWGERVGHARGGLGRWKGASARGR